MTWRSFAYGVAGPGVGDGREPTTFRPLDGPRMIKPARRAVLPSDERGTLGTGAFVGNNQASSPIRSQLVDYAATSTSRFQQGSTAVIVCMFCLTRASVIAHTAK